MADRLDDALAALADALRAEVRAELAERSDSPPELLSIAQAARRLGIGRSRLYAEIGAGGVRSLRIGRRRLIPSDALAEFIGGRSA